MNAFFTQHISKFQQEVLDFYNKHGRHNLSFRQTTNPYHIHISEVMLSQTQVERVEKYFTKWITLFPTIQSVIRASKTDLLQAWQGLGYNSRVLNFQIACKQVLREFNGEYPQTDKELQSLKGIGPYISAAIMAFAFNENIGVVDTNIRRILIYYKFIDKATSSKEVQKIAKQLTPKNQARKWNNALMDFGALHLTAGKTKIPSLGKQGKFIGSTRYIRSQIIKECLKNGSCSIDCIKKEYTKYNHNIEDVIHKLIKEQMVYKTGNMLYIVDNT